MTYPALVQLEGMVYDEEITIGRDGSLQVRLTHQEISLFRRSGFFFEQEFSIYGTEV